YRLQPANEFCVLWRGQALLQGDHQALVIASEKSFRMNPQAWKCAHPVNAVRIRRKLLIGPQIKPAKLPLRNTGDQVFEHTVSGIVIALGVQADGAAAPCDFTEKFWRALNVLIFCRAGLAPKLGENPQEEVRLRLSFFS